MNSFIVVELHQEGSATNEATISSSLKRYIHKMKIRVDGRCYDKAPHLPLKPPPPTKKSAKY